MSEKTRQVLDHETIKKLQIIDEIKLRNKPPFMDMDRQDIQDIVEYLLRELTFNNCVTSVSRTIPFIDEEHPLRIVIGVYDDAETVKRTFEGEGPEYISKIDLVNEMNNALKNSFGGVNDIELHHALTRIAYNLGFIDDFEDKVRWVK